MNKQFFSLLCNAIGTEHFPEHSLNSDEWREVFKMSCVQGVTAVVFDFVKTLPQSEAPDMELLME